MKKHQNKIIILLMTASVVVTITITELALRLFAPFYISPIGHSSSQNAQKYGWGYNPHQLITLKDPDKEAIYTDRINNYGWRDKDRHYENFNNAYRILVLGDSNTFGCIVPASKIYTRVLEDKLLALGYNVEVISMAYGGWGTDQQLEALQNEGIKFNPHLIIVQFCNNDITDNAYFYSVPEDSALKGWKPFYYTIDGDGNLIKHQNPYFLKQGPRNLKEVIKEIINKSEILKRLYALYLLFRDRVTPKYQVTKQQLSQLKTVLNLSDDSKFYQYLYEHLEQSLNADELLESIKLYNHEDEKKIILRILEHRFFQKYWFQQRYYPSKVDSTSENWRLYFALVKKMQKAARQIGADLAIFNETELGHYQWSLSWYRVSGDETSKRNYLDHIRAIKTYMSEQGIGVIENTIPYHRARNNSHPNIAGNHAMAEDIFKYLMKHYKNELENHKKAHNQE